MAVDFLNAMSFNACLSEDSQVGRNGIISAVQAGQAGQADIVGF